MRINIPKICTTHGHQPQHSAVFFLSGGWRRCLKRVSDFLSRSGRRETREMMLVGVCICLKMEHEGFVGVGVEVL